MPFTPFPDTAYWRVLETNSEIHGGSFNLQSTIDLKHMLCTMIVSGTTQGSEQIRAHLYGTSEIGASPIASSEWFSVSDIGSYTNCWIGNFYLNFDDVPLNPNFDYHVGFETQNYARVGDEFGDTFWLGLKLDWYYAYNIQGSATQAPISMRLLGQRDVRI